MTCTVTMNDGMQRLRAESVAGSPARIERRFLEATGPLFVAGLAKGRTRLSERSSIARGKIRGDFTFGEQILDIADDGTNDWIEAKNGGAARVNKEVVLRSKLRIEARQFHMARLHRETWGDRQQIDVKNDWNLLTQEERRRKADEMIAMIRELREPPPQPPPLVYRWEEAPDDEPATAGEIGWQRRSAAGPEG